MKLYTGVSFNTNCIDTPVYTNMYSSMIQQVYSSMIQLVYTGV